MLCALAHQFPTFVESFLEKSQSLRRKFREETVTDILMGSLITAGGKWVRVEYPDEPVTGADMEWNFINRDDGTFFRILLQAKKSYGSGNVWTRHNYRELFHKVQGSGDFQAVRLCETARNTSSTYPLYILYNRAGTCNAARRGGCWSVSGACLADGYAVEQLVSGATSQLLRTRNKSLKTIAPLMFPLSKLLCPQEVLRAGPFAFVPQVNGYLLAAGNERGRQVLGIPIPPTPRAVRNRIALIRADMMESGVDSELPEVPHVTTEIPKDMWPILDGAGDDWELDKGLRHIRVTFVSSNPRETDEYTRRHIPFD